MLSPELKKDIQGAYTSLLDKKSYKARFCQKQMVADIANTLGSIESDAEGIRTSDNPICVVEAGTGTGKTVAYAIASLPIAMATNKTLIISTATIALQEQIVFVDLPDIKKHSGLDFTFALAKGRRRYLCLARLDMALQASQSNNHSLAFYEDEMYAFDETHTLLYENMLQKLGRGDWDGDRDNWSQEIDHGAWAGVSTDHVQCTGRQCSHYENCYFYKARERIHKVDCIVTNHDLVLSDVMMGGGAVLPAPEEVIFVFDEGHHLPDKAINHFSSFLQVRGTQAWLEQIPGSLEKLTDELGDIANLARKRQQISDDIRDLKEQLEHFLFLVSPLRDKADGDENNLRYRFPGGKVDFAIQEMSEALYQAEQRLGSQLALVQRDIEEDMLSEENDKERLEHWAPVVANMCARIEAGAGLWRDYMVADPSDEPPKARWLKFMEADELMVQASPIAVHQSLEELLWSRCYGAVITSATLSIGGDFTRFMQRTGISPESSFRVLQSPFNHQQQGVLQIPRMRTDPRQADDHNAEVAELLPDLIGPLDGSVGGVLILFASWRQMNRVVDGLPPELMAHVLQQGEHSKAEIVSQHKLKVDKGEPSIIFGQASFSEGIDLPGNYCNHVIIIKIPFAVPDDPVGATLSEWIEAAGGNSFQEIMIPDAVLRMVQASGRLLRTEKDSGIITILDRRMVSQRYGNIIMNALPPFRRDIQ